MTPGNGKKGFYVLKYTRFEILYIQMRRRAQTLLQNQLNIYTFLFWKEQIWNE